MIILKIHGIFLSSCNFCYLFLFLFDNTVAVVPGFYNTSDERTHLFKGCDPFMKPFCQNTL